jgi:hypothetical protein
MIEKGYATRARTAGDSKTCKAFHSNAAAMPPKVPGSASIRKKPLMNREDE